MDFDGFRGEGVKLNPNWEKASTVMTVPRNSSRQALIICTQVVATMPPKVTYTTIKAPTIWTMR